MLCLNYIGAQDIYRYLEYYSTCNRPIPNWYPLKFPQPDFTYVTSNYTAADKCINTNSLGFRINDSNTNLWMNYKKTETKFITFL